MLVMIKMLQYEMALPSYQTLVSEASGIDLERRLGYGRATASTRDQGEGEEP
jgi:hypothetical protein